MKRIRFLVLLVLFGSSAGCMFLGYRDNGFHVEGRVLDEAGNPVEGAAVSLFGSLTTTDENGCFLYRGSTADSETEFHLTKKGMQYIRRTLPVKYYRVDVVLKPMESTTESVVGLTVLKEHELREGLCSED